MSTLSNTFEGAAALLKKYGWCQGYYKDQKGRICVGTAIWIAEGNLKYEDVPVGCDSLRGNDLFLRHSRSRTRAIKVFVRSVCETLSPKKAEGIGSDCVEALNNDIFKSRKSVLNALEMAAERY